MMRLRAILDHGVIDALAWVIAALCLAGLVAQIVG